MPIATDKSTMLEAVTNGWWRFQRALEQFTETEMDEVRIQGNWTVKDIVAHIAFWERNLLNRLDRIEAGLPPDGSDEGYTAADIDRLNLENYQAHQQSYLHEVLAEAAATHEALFTVLIHLPEDSADERFWQMIAGDTYEHYEEHLQEFEAYLQRTGKPGLEYPEGGL
jgi:hypothetical protein